MATIELKLPKMGESVAEASILNWLKKEGDRVTADEPLVEIATDKVNSEVPSPEDGILISCKVNVGDTVQVGHVIAIIETEAGAEMPVHTAPQVAETISQPTVTQVSQSNTPVSVVSSGDRFYSPLVKNIAKQEGLTQEELDRVAGTGQNGRVTKDDLMGYLKTRGTAPVAKPEVVASSGQAAGSVKTAVEIQKLKGPAISIGGNDEVIEMDRMRKLIADHMVMSKQVSPHVTSYVEADVTNIVMWRDKVKKSFEQNYKTKLTFTPIFIEAVAKAIRDFPGVNASVDGDKIVLRGDINVGMAAALPTGNLIVPVIKNADQLNLVGLAKKVNDLADRARANKLTPDEIQGGTYTLTNVGSFGNVMGTPIINQPQVAILAVGAIRKKPAVIETPQGDAIAIRHMMFLSHSYDHRIVDGALGGRFVRRVADYLEEWDVNREI